MAFFVYMLRCADESYYIGQANNLEQRIALHEARLGGVYTHQRLPVALAWSQEFPTRLGAVACERQITRWSRARTHALPTADRPTLSPLARSRRSTGSPQTATANLAPESTSVEPRPCHPSVVRLS